MSILSTGSPAAKALTDTLRRERRKLGPADLASLYGLDVDEAASYLRALADIRPLSLQPERAITVVPEWELIRQVGIELESWHGVRDSHVRADREEEARSGWRRGELMGARAGEEEARAGGVREEEAEGRKRRGEARARAMREAEEEAYVEEATREGRGMRYTRADVRRHTLERHGGSIWACGRCGVRRRQLGLSSLPAKISRSSNPL